MYQLYANFTLRYPGALRKLNLLTKFHILLFQRHILLILYIQVHFMHFEESIFVGFLSKDSQVSFDFVLSAGNIIINLF
jgi:hypothetical protein